MFSVKISLVHKLAFGNTLQEFYLGYKMAEIQINLQGIVSSAVYKSEM